jgi:hypothetical protein
MTDERKIDERVVLMRRQARHVHRHEVVQPQDPSYRLIPLTYGQNTIVDTENYDWLMQWEWEALWDPKTKSYYAVRYQRDKIIWMHREIMKRAGKM